MNEPSLISNTDELQNSKEHGSNFFMPLSIYFELIKLKQTFLLVFTSFFAYLISAYPTISWIDSIWLLFSMFLAVSGSTLLNMYIDRDIDKIMERTHDRPLPAGKVSHKTVLAHGILFSVVGILAAGLFLNIITMLAIFAGFFFDVVVYSIWLKRKTKLSILFGGIAGGLPAIAGRAVVIGTIDWISILMGLFILTWIPLHILTLSLLPKNLKGYSNANVPMWPVVSGKKQTMLVITISAMICMGTAILLSWLLSINMIVFIILIILSVGITSFAVINLIIPSEKITWTIFKLASMFMALAFILWLIGVAV